MRIVAMVLAVCLLFSAYLSADDLNNDIYVYELEEDFISIKGIKDNNLSGKNNKSAYIFKYKCGRNSIYGRDRGDFIFCNI